MRLLYRKTYVVVIIRSETVKGQRPQTVSMPPLRRSYGRAATTDLTGYFSLYHNRSLVSHVVNQNGWILLTIRSSRFDAFRCGIQNIKDDSVQVKHRTRKSALLIVNYGVTYYYCSCHSPLGPKK